MDSIFGICTVHITYEGHNTRAGDENIRLRIIAKINSSLFLQKSAGIENVKKCTNILRKYV